MAAPIEVAEARRLVQLTWETAGWCRPPWEDAQVLACAEAVGRVLAEAVRAEADSPPYDKSLVDGYAVRAEDLSSGTARLRVVAEILAGQVSDVEVRPGTAARIMTGAPLPRGADAVVMVERTRLLPLPDAHDAAIASNAASEHGPANENEASGAHDGQDDRYHDFEVVEVLDAEGGPVVVGQSILRRAAVVRQGDMVLSPGHRVRAVDAGLLAEAGRSTIAVARGCRVALFQTGDEVVPAGQPLGPAQIRNSNGPLLAALLRDAGAEVLDLGIVPDEEEALLAAIGRGLESDMLVVTGGVSRGVRDLVPPLLRAQGVREVFHRVAMKPGQPLWFGERSDANRATLVFGLPGNPVSGLVGGLLFACPAIRHALGQQDVWDAGWRWGVLDEPCRGNARLTTFWPAALRRVDAAWSSPAAATPPGLVPLRWQGSADLFTLGRAQALVELPPAATPYERGASVRWRPLV
jgi:molybdopterin molybdotransferase